MVGLVIYIGVEEVYIYFEGNEESNYKCYKYLNNEHKEFVLFEDLRDLEKFFISNPEVCNQDFSIEPRNDIKIKNETIEVELLEEEIDSLFVKIKYREFIIKREYFTLKCFVNKYSPEDFTF